LETKATRTISVTLSKYYRKEALREAGFRCAICEDKFYEWNLVLHHETPTKLVVLCRECHQYIHWLLRRGILTDIEELKMKRRYHQALKRYYKRYL